MLFTLCQFNREFSFTLYTFYVILYTDLTLNTSFTDLNLNTSFPLYFLQAIKSQGILRRLSSMLATEGEEEEEQ